MALANCSGSIPAALHRHKQGSGHEAAGMRAFRLDTAVVGNRAREESETEEEGDSTFEPATETHSTGIDASLFERFLHFILLFFLLFDLIAGVRQGVDIQRLI